MNIGLFIPCFIDQIQPATAESMKKILLRAGVNVHYSSRQTCCGQVAFNNGFWDEAKHLGEKFIRDFMEYDYVVGPSASCIAMVRNYYTEMFYNSAWHNENKYLQKKIFEFTDFLVNVIKKPDLGAELNARVCFHDSCSALREYGLKDEPRTLMAHVKGLELVEMKHSDECCGFGGTFAVKHEPISTAMAREKLKNAIDTGAMYLVSTEGSCLMHLQTYIDKHKLNISTLHLADLLAMALPD